MRERSDGGREEGGGGCGKGGGHGRGAWAGDMGGKGSIAVPGDPFLRC